MFARCSSNEDDMFPKGAFLLGDAAYQLQTWLITPYKNNGHFLNDQHKFNFKISATRCVIERAFGRLKGKFPRLTFVDMGNLNDICLLVFRLCTLHNFCINKSDLYFGEGDCETDPNWVPSKDCYWGGSNTASSRRETLMQKLCQKS